MHTCKDKSCLEEVGMKFFLVSWAANGNPVPRIVNWRTKLDYHAVQTGEIERLQKRTLLYIENNPETVFTDIICRPFLLVSSLIWDVMKMYDIRQEGKQIILLDGVYGFAEIYYLQKLPECVCLHDDTEFNNDGTIIKKLILDKEIIENLPPLFRVAGIQKDYVIGRLDFVESILRRGAKGIKLEELEGR